MLLDNKAQGRAVDALRKTISPGSSASILTNEFSIFAWNELRKDMAHLEAVRLLLPSGAFPTQGGQDIPQLLGDSLQGGPEERRYRNTLSAPNVARACANWIETKCDVRAANAMVPHNLYCIEPPGEGHGAVLQGSSTCTAPGLGLTPSDRYEFNTLVKDGEGVGGLLELFVSLWSVGWAEIVPSSGVEPLPEFLDDVREAT